MSERGDVAPVRVSRSLKTTWPQVLLRQRGGAPDAVARALGERRIVRTWAMRGTSYLGTTT